jgi:hypothetical protein
VVGLGFAVSEDIFYFIFQFGGDIPSVIEGFYVRVIASGIYGHVMFTGISAIGLAYFVSRRGEQSFSRRFLVAAGLLLTAMAAHFIWNSPFLGSLPILLYGLVKGLPFLIFLVVLVILARRREHAAVADLLASEVGRAGLTEREVELLRNRHARREATRLATRSGGAEAKHALRRTSISRSAHLPWIRSTTRGSSRSASRHALSAPHCSHCLELPRHLG